MTTYDQWKTRAPDDEREDEEDPTLTTDIHEAMYPASQQPTKERNAQVETEQVPR